MNACCSKDDGERVDLEVSAFSTAPTHRGREGHTVRQHLARYRWASYLAGGAVLDAACGTGYGAALLSEGVDSVVGIDVSASAVERARIRAPSCTILCASLPAALGQFSDGDFDTVVSFETVEHIEDAEALIAGFHRVLKPGGRLLISTPNAVSPLGDPPAGPSGNPFHVREYTRGEFLHLLAMHKFNVDACYSQNGVAFNWLRRQAYRLTARFPSVCNPSSRIDRLAHGRDDVEAWIEGTEPWILVLDCSR